MGSSVISCPYFDAVVIAVSAAAAKAHDDKVKELSGKIKDLEASVAASTKESAAAVADAKAAGAKEAEQAIQKTLDDVRAHIELLLGVLASTGVAPRLASGMVWVLGVQ